MGTLLVRPTRTHEELTKEAWARLDEFTLTGRITLPKGAGPDGESARVVKPDKDDPTCKVLVDVFKWLAQFQGKPKKVPRAMDDWAPKVTKS